jgi:UDP-N-acetylmuramoyl-tripeptide--D-alanyl-D-alanine ligase
MPLTTKDILAALPEAEIHGPEPVLSFERVCTDTRGDCQGALYVALKGESFDGNAFLNQAARAGALGALIGPTADPAALPSGLQCFRVADTLAALQRLAVWYRQSHSLCRAVAVTGSNGKSTTKQMIASVVSRRFRTLATQGNLNNHIGVPLTLLGLSPETEILVAEIGANHPGEVRSLAGMVKPDISVITNVAPCHLEGFGSLEGVLRAKLELFEGTNPGGVCIFNGDDPRLSGQAPKVFPHTLSFGLGQRNWIRGSEISLDSSGCASFLLEGTLRIRLNIPGRHNVMNAIAAAAVGRVLDLKDSEIKAGLESAVRLGMRMQLRDLGWIKVLNDAYNANPFSMREALNTLETIEHPGRRVAVIGEMLELGGESSRLHCELAVDLAGRRLGLILLVGRFAGQMKEAFTGAGGDPGLALTAPDAASGWEALRNSLEQGDLLLLKGSRGVRLEQIMQKLEERARE